MMAVMDPTFMMGSMGSVVGEKITRTDRGGRRGKAAAADRQLLRRRAHAGVDAVADADGQDQRGPGAGSTTRADCSSRLLTDPTTGGVTASFAMLGDFIIAEPKALIGFAGPRTIWNTIKVELPEGFQRSEFLEEHGFIDFVVHRKDLRSEIARLVDFCAAKTLKSVRARVSKWGQWRKGGARGRPPGRCETMFRWFRQKWHSVRWYCGERHVALSLRFGAAEGNPSRRPTIQKLPATGPAEAGENPGAAVERPDEERILADVLGAVEEFNRRNRTAIRVAAIRYRADDTTGHLEATRKLLNRM